MAKKVKQEEKPMGWKDVLPVIGVGLVLILVMEVVDNASDENNENTRRKATVVPIKIEYV